jgi:hypothetical protein
MSYMLRLLCITSFLIISPFIVSNDDDCLVVKRVKKEKTSELQEKLLQLLKDIARENSQLIQELAISMQDIIEILEEGNDGILGEKNKETLRTKTQELEKYYASIKKCRNDIKL